MESKEIIVAIVGIIGSVIVTIVWNNLIKQNTINLIFILMGLLALFVLIIDNSLD